jgi:hypothetical protein
VSIILTTTLEEVAATLKISVETIERKAATLTSPWASSRAGTLSLHGMHEQRQGDSHGHSSKDFHVQQC